MSLIVYIFSVFCPCRRSSSALRVRSAGHVLNLNKGCTKRQSLPNCQQNGRPGREYRPGKQDARCYFVRNGAATKLRKAEAFSRKGRPTEPLRNDTASSSRRHAGRDSADTKAVVRTERQRKEVRRRATGYRRRTTNGKRWTMDGATGDGQQAARGWTAMDGDGRRWTAMDGDGRRWTAGERSKEWRKKNQTEYRRRRTDRQSWRAAGRESYGQRELRAEGATGRQEENVRQEGRQRKERCNEDRQDSGVRRQKKQACATAGPTTRPEGRHTIFISARPEYASQRRESSYRPA